ncbi:hypothetical protein D3C75_1185750 [compost metagenome]
MMVLLLLLSSPALNFRIQIHSILRNFQQPSHVINTGDLRLHTCLVHTKRFE